MSYFDHSAGEQETGGGKNRRLLTGRVPQLMVFLNGMVLTIVAYLVLSVFTRDIMMDEYRNMTDEAREVLGVRISEMENNLNLISTILALSNVVTGEEAQARLKSASSKMDLFDHLIWIYPSEGSWKYRDLVDYTDKNKLISLTTGEGKSLIQHILSKRAQKNGGSFVLLDFEGAEYIQENTDPVVKGRYFVYARNIRGETGDKGVLAAVSRVSLMANTDWMVERDMIHRLAVRDAESGRRLLLLDRNPETASDSGGASDFTYDYEMDVANSVWKVEMRLGKDKNMLLLQQSPILMLFFGLTLTIVGTMYVRNNQRQSYRLSGMNRALAQKNYELNSEVAERERLNQNLRKVEREYRAIIDSVSDIIFELNVEGDILFLNETWPRVTGTAIDHSLNRNIFDMLHPQDQIEQKSAFRQLVAGKRPAYRAFTRLITGDGTYHAVELAMSMLRQDESRQIRVVGMITDIEDRRRTERALTEAEKKYRTIVENAAGGIYQVTPEGQFVSANPAFARILGYDHADQMMRFVRNAHEQLYKNPRERSRFVRELEQTGAVRDYETEMLTKTGEVIWVSENARAVRDEDNRIVYYEGSIENITQRKEAEINMRKAIMESDMASRAKSEFLANMSHELRTPLNAIIGFSEIIKNEVFGPISQRQYWEYARDIHDSGRQLLRIINDILDVSRIEAGERQLNESLIDMDRLVSSCLNFVSGRIEEAKLQVNNLCAGTVPNLVGEDLAVKQSLLNLLSNAVKFTQPGGSITISHEIDNFGQLRLSVTDTGVGMDESEIEKALSPFGQINSALSRATSGSGLGLTLVTSLMKLHGGSLELVSQKGIGTTATLVFPKKRVAIDTAKKKTEAEKVEPAAIHDPEADGDQPTNRTIQ